MAVTKDKFGVPLTASANSAGGILMPKLKYRFRVNFNAPFGLLKECGDVCSAFTPGLSMQMTTS